MSRLTLEIEMTDLAQKIADAVCYEFDSLNSTQDRPILDEVIADAIRSALPVAQGEAVACIKGLPLAATHFAATETVAHAWGRFPICIRACRYVEGELEVFSTDSDNDYPRWESASKVFLTLPPVFPLYAAPPASRIAELEREVERLREAAITAARMALKWPAPDIANVLNRALAAQEKK